MKILTAKLTSWNEFEFVTDTNDYPRFQFTIGNQIVFGSYIVGNDKHFKFRFDYDGELLGHYIHIKTETQDVPVDISELVRRRDFDYFYAYEGNDLGPTYSRKSTKFVLWAPLAHKVEVKINGSTYPLTRSNRGVFRGEVKGNLDGKLYTYLVYIGAKVVETIDPYAKSGNTNNEKSAVINLERLKFKHNDELLPKLDNKLQSIIYEGHVRDLTVHESSNIQHKGLFLGLTEEGRKTPNKNPAGFDYLVSLGFTHLQLQPILEFGSVDEKTRGRQYNWGYDPMHFFTLEGSYSTNPEDPYARIVEFQKVISSFHKKGIRINIDVVYNHVFKYKDFALAKITPNYFFRYENNKMANHSFCGNDFCSERAMARKVIVDSCKFLFDFYHIDGLRFDLMGLIDVETMNQVYDEVKKIKPDALLYGEGWNMVSGSEFVDDIEYAHMGNASRLKGYSFFNDSYRNIMRGHGGRAKMDENGFLLGNKDYFDGAQFALYACTQTTIYPKIFETVDQSINYVECHDNATIFDVINESTDFDEDALRIVKLFNKVLLFSPGIPFIHAGQEIGLSKKNQSNTYNLGDYYNAFDYSLLDKRYELVGSLKSYISIRKEIPTFLINDPYELKNSISFGDHEKIIEMILSDNLSQSFEYHIFINPYDKASALEKAGKMELLIPSTIKKDAVQINLIETGIARQKCSIFKKI